MFRWLCCLNIYSFIGISIAFGRSGKCAEPGALRTGDEITVSYHIVYRR